MIRLQRKHRKNGTFGIKQENCSFLSPDPRFNVGVLTYITHSPQSLHDGSNMCLGTPKNLDRWRLRALCQAAVQWYEMAAVNLPLLSLASCVTSGRLLTSLSLGIIICQTELLHYRVVIIQMMWKASKYYLAQSECARNINNHYYCCCYHHHSHRPTKCRTGFRNKGVNLNLPQSWNGVKMH